MRPKHDAKMKRIVITLSLLVLLTLGSAPEDSYAQTQCPNASDVQFPFDPNTWTLAQDFGVPSPRHQGRYHTGEDWFLSGADSLGQPVHAMAAGRVTYSFPLGWGRDGGVVIIEHIFDDGTIVYSQYGHMMETDTIKFPMRLSCVEAGQIIGAVGSARPAPHLHFEIKLEGADNPGPGYSWTNPYTDGWRQASEFVLNRQAWSQNWHRWHLQTNDPNGFQAPPLLLSDSSLLYIDGLSLRLATYDGRVLWRVILERPALAVVAGPDQPLVIYQDGTVVQIDPSSEGAAQDSWQLPEQFAAVTPIVAGDQVLLRTADDALVALSADRRSIDWRVDEVPLYKDSYVAPELIALLTQSNALILLSRNGDVISRAQLRGSVGFDTAPDQQLVVYGRGGLWKVNRSGEWGPLLNGETPIQVAEDASEGSEAVSVVYVAETRMVYAFDGRALNAYDMNGSQQWTVPLALTGQVEIAPVGGLLLLLSSHGDLVAVQPDGVLCAAGRVYGDSRSLLWYSPEEGSVPADNVFRVAVGDQMVGVDWEQFIHVCRV